VASNDAARAAGRPLPYGAYPADAQLTPAQTAANAAATAAGKPLPYPPAPTIMPTVGRAVWFHPHGGSSEGNTANQILAAHIALVKDPRTVNLMVIGESGDTHGERNVYLWDGVLPVPTHPYAEWPLDDAQGRQYPGAGYGLSGDANRNQGMAKARGERA
jgi:hypothetical protein